MEKNEALLAKYKALTAEWSTVSIVTSILFASTILGLVFSLVFFNPGVTFIVVVLMVMFALFENRSRNIYIKERADLEEQMFKGTGLKKKGIVEKGIIW
jgi:hypothetical protein